MRVKLRRNAEVPQILRRVTCLLHRAKRVTRDDFFGGTTFDLRQNFLEVTRLQFATFACGDVQTEMRQKLIERLNFVGTRQLVHAVQTRNFFRDGVACDGLVGKQHAFLDNRFSDGLHAFGNFNRATLRVQQNFHFGQVEID